VKGDRSKARLPREDRSKRRRSDAERLGEPELARREKRRRPFRRKRD
jgi:hypothetical protein